MPPRFSYWTIIAGGLPTAFRAAEREELLPTFTRLKEKQPDAEMKWFARGKLWSSPEEAQNQRDRRFDSGQGKNRHRDQQRPGGHDGTGESRGRDWRPGGEHRDPRQQFKDAKKARNQRLKADKFARKSKRDGVPRERPHGDPLTPERRPRPEGPRHSGAGADRKEWTPKPRGGNDGGWRARSPSHERDGGRSSDRRREPEWQNREPKPDRPTGPQGGRREWTPAASRENSRRDAAPRERPHGDPLAPERRPRPHDSRQGDPGANRKKWSDKPDRGKAEGWRPRAPAGDRNSGRSDPRESKWQNRGPKPHAPAGPQGGRREWTPAASRENSRRDVTPRERPHGDPLAPERRPRPHGSREADPNANRKKWSDERGGGRSDSWQPRGPAGDRKRGGSDRRESEWQNRGPKPHAPAGSQGARREWTTKPPREKPHGDALARPSRPSGDRDRSAPSGPRGDSRGSQSPRSDARGTYRGQGHGDNSWKPKPPRDDRDAGGRGGRPFEPRGFDRDRARGTANQEPTPPPRPRGPNREPRPSDTPAPDAPPRPSEPIISPPGPPERGRLNRNKRSR